MSTFDYLILIALLAVATVVTRSFFFLIGGAARMPSWLQHALRYAPATALAAILAPDLLLSAGSGGSLAVPWTNPKLLAGIAASLFFLRTRHLLGTIIIGMLCFTALRLLLGA